MSKTFLSLLFMLSVSGTNAQIFTSYLNFLGGEQQLRSIHSRIDSGTYNYGGIEFPFVSWSKSPDRYKYIVSSKGKYFAQAFDGTEGWKIDVFKGEKKKTILTGKAAKAMANEADVELEPIFIDYRKKGYKGHFPYKDTVDNIPCIDAMLTREDTAVYSFATHTGALLRKTARAKNSELDGAILDTYYSDYRKVGDILIPFKIVNKIKDQTVLTITLKSVTLNPPIADDIFSATSQP